MTDPPVDWIDGKAYFRNLPVLQHVLTIAGRDFTIHALRDAADLLDQPDFAKEFVENDVAPYGMELWPAARMLAEHILNDENGDGRSAIELGCGLGLVSIAAAVKGWRIVATDNEETSLRFAQLNATDNGVEPVGFERLDWRDPPRARSYDRVFAADILYQAVDHEPILKCLDTLLVPDGVAYIADPNRSVADRFPALAGDFGFVVETTSTRSIQSDGRHVAGRMHVLTR